MRKKRPEHTEPGVPRPKRPKAGGWRRGGNAAKTVLSAVVANAKGQIIDLEGYAAVGMDGEILSPLTATQTIQMPYGSELMQLPGRHPVVLNLATGAYETLKENPYFPGEPVFPVAVFNSPGYVITHFCGHRAMPGLSPLPLFSYGAVGWHDSGFRCAAIQVDREPRQDLRRMPREKVQAGVDQLRKTLPENRLRRHLENCALTYGCPAGKNFFLGRYEAPLPTSRQCNARCLGCISWQPESEIHCSQERIRFTPTPEEIAEVALTHIRRVRKAVVSFGQGCEGDPLLAAGVIVPAIRLIRKRTAEGTIHMNTNASLPEVLKGLFEAGLDSIRVSLNSVQPHCYDAYFRPHGYAFADVVKSIELGLAKGRFVSLNYLNMPGFTDSTAESAAFIEFVKAHPVHMIQWRNLNFDPPVYLAEMQKASESAGKPVGVRNLLNMVRKTRPDIRFGYFNPPRELW